MEEQIQPATPAPKSGLAKIIIINAAIALVVSAIVSFAVSSIVVNQNLAGLAEMQKKVEALTGKINIK